MHIIVALVHMKQIRGGKAWCKRVNIHNPDHNCAVWNSELYQLKIDTLKNSHVGGIWLSKTGHFIGCFPEHLWSLHQNIKKSPFWRVPILPKEAKYSSLLNILTTTVLSETIKYTRWTGHILAVICIWNIKYHTCFQSSRVMETGVVFNISDTGWGGGLNTIKY